MNYHFFDFSNNNSFIKKNFINFKLNIILEMKKANFLRI